MGVPEYLLASHPGGQLVAEQSVKTPVLDPTAQQFPAFQQMHYKVHYTQSKPVALTKIRVWRLICTHHKHLRAITELWLSRIGLSDLYIRKSQDSTAVLHQYHLVCQ